jgi:hypothetical protein
MAWASVGAHNTAQSSTSNQTSIAAQLVSTVNAGQVLLAVIAVDNNQTTDGDESAVTGVSDPAGNTWSKAAEFTNGQGTAQAGATCSIWYCLVTSSIAGGLNITASFQMLRRETRVL